MPAAESRTRIAAERARERDVCSFYPLSLDITDLSPDLGDPDSPLPPPNHRPRASADPVLTAFAQLGTLRLGAARSLISLIDTKSQIILAEGTSTLSLRSHLVHDQGDALWLGSAIIPRSHAVCDAVLDDSTAPGLIINDMRLDDRYSDNWGVKTPPYARFYAGVPLKSPSGNIIGVYCVVDDKPRDGLEHNQLLFLEDVAAAVVSYLGTCRAQDNNRKAELMIRGLTSFVTGAADVQAREDLNVPRELEDPDNSEPLPHRDTSGTSQAPESDESSCSEIDDETIALQSHILPSGAKRMFSRAANIMRESSDLQGVIIFDASMANPRNSEEPGQGPAPPGDEVSESETYISTSYTASSSSSSGPPSDGSEGRTANCKILGFADARRSSRDNSNPRRDYLGLSEETLRQLLTRHPNGKIFNIWRSEPQGVPHQRVRSGKPKRTGAVDAIVDVAHNARSAAIIPLWDYERGRWFAGCLCWVSTPNRLLTHGADLLYLRAFGNSIMNELSRLDAAAVNQAKTTFIESMSHEMRSPLHGILGGVEYLNGLPMDAFQANIVNSIAMCGRTLLDTVQNVLEYSKINELTGLDANDESQRSLDSPHPQLCSDICQLTEETVEAVFAGKSYNILAAPAGPSTPHFFSEVQSPTMMENPASKAVRIILDFPPRESWTFAIRAGVWRRILMNVFGNALKYTETGFIRVSLSAEDRDSSHTEITLTVADSGIGMSSKYLQEGLFKPFSQENPFSPGIGLGMSIVNRLVRSIGGDITVKSEARVGTELKIVVTLSNSERPKQRFESAVAGRAKAKQIAIVGEGIEHGEKEPPTPVVCEERFYESLASTLKNWFGVRVVDASKETSIDSSHLIIYPGPSFNAMFKKRTRKGVSVVVALDALEAATLKADERISQHWIEVVTQPIGPFKLSHILDRYLSRLDAESRAPELKADITAVTTPGPSSTSYQFPLRPLITSSPPPEREETPSSAGGSDVEAREKQSQPMSSPRSPSPVTEIRSPVSVRSPTMLSRRLPSGSWASSERTWECGEARDILIVDDNPLNLRLLAAFLNKNGLSHGSASNGLEAVEQYKKNPKRWAAILMDISMPVMDGVTATKEIRSFEFRRSLERNNIVEKGQLLRESSSDSNKTLKEWKRRSREIDPEGEAEAVARAIERGEVPPETLDGGSTSEDSAPPSSSSKSTHGGRDDPNPSEGQPSPVSELGSAPLSDTNTEQPAPPLVPPPDEEAQQAEAASGVPIIVITGLGSATARYEAMNAGADVFMTKPIQFGALMKTLKGRMSS